MKTTNLRKFEENGFVLRFSSSERGINADTYGKVLVSISKAIRSINKNLDSNYKVKTVVLSEKPGCFIVHLMPLVEYSLPIAKGLWQSIVAPLLVLYIFHKAFPDASLITINNNGDIILSDKSELGKIDISDNALEAFKKVSHDPSFNNSISEFAKAIHADSSLSKVSIYNGVDEQDSVLKLSQEQMVNLYEVEKSNDESEVILTVHKLVFDNLDRKWEFMLNDEIISAYISDKKFLSKMKEGRFSISKDKKFRAKLITYKERDLTSKEWRIRGYKIIELNEYED